MTHCSPRTQTRDLLDEKERIARRLLASGLTSQQVRAQLRCSRGFLARIRSELEVETRRFGEGENIA